MGGPPEVTISGSTLSAPGQGQGSPLHARVTYLSVSPWCGESGQVALPVVLGEVGSVIGLP